MARTNSELAIPSQSGLLIPMASRWADRLEFSIQPIVTKEIEGSKVCGDTGRHKDLIVERFLESRFLFSLIFVQFSTDFKINVNNEHIWVNEWRKICFKVSNNRKEKGNLSFI